MVYCVILQIVFENQNRKLELINLMKWFRMEFLVDFHRMSDTMAKLNCHLAPSTPSFLVPNKD